MSYRVRFTTQTGATGYWEGTFATRAGATHSAQSRADITGYTYAVEEVPQPGSTAAHDVEILRERVKELEAVQKAMHLDLCGALDIGNTMHEAIKVRDHEMADYGKVCWERLYTRLAKAPSVPVGASEAPREGGDSDRRRLEALERWLRVDTYRLVFFAGHGVMVALSDSVGADDVEAPTLSALADKLAEKEAKP